MGEQSGIKWWKICPVCTWAAKTRGAIGEVENALTQCPNCNNPRLHVGTDELVFEERRYDVKVRNTRGQEVADEVRQNAGRPPAPPDTVNTGNPGHQYPSEEDKPFDEDGNSRPATARQIVVPEDVDPSVTVVVVAPPANGNGA